MLSIVEIDRGTPAATSTKTVSLEIDGRSIAVPEGTSVMRAASLAGIRPGEKRQRVGGEK